MHANLAELRGSQLELPSSIMALKGPSISRDPKFPKVTSVQTRFYRQPFLGHLLVLQRISRAKSI